MGSRKRESEHDLVITFRTADPSVAITFSKEESTGVRAVILDILTEAYRERLQRASLYPKAGRHMKDCAAFRTFIL